MKNEIHIKVDTKLYNEDAAFLQPFLDNREANGSTIKEFIEFLFYAGFSFFKGKVLGECIASTLETSHIGNAEKIPENLITVDRVFYDGEPAQFSLTDGGIIIKFKTINTKTKDTKYHTIQIMNKNKALKF